MHLEYSNRRTLSQARYGGTMHIPVVVLHIAEYGNKNYWGPGFSGLVIDTPARNISSVDSKLTAMTELQQRTSLHLGIY